MSRGYEADATPRTAAAVVAQVDAPRRVRRVGRGRAFGGVASPDISPWVWHRPGRISESGCATKHFC
jgi:hypothetical protein